jgi:hypothetical protein
MASQSQGGKAAQQVGRDDQRLEKQGHRQCAEGSLQADDGEKQCDGNQGLAAVLAEAHRPREQHRNDHDQSAREIPVNHFVQCFAEL